MSALLSLGELKAHLGIPATDTTQDGVLTVILESLWAQLLADTNRTHRPFAAAISGRVERKPGQCSATLLLDYPIQTLTSVVLGEDPAEPAETITVGDVKSVSWAVGSREITRVDGKSWGPKSHPRYVHVTYDTQAFLPDVAKAALMHEAAKFYRGRGSEGSRREAIGNTEREIIEPLAGASLGNDSRSPLWYRATSSLWEAFT